MFIPSTGLGMISNPVSIMPSVHVVLTDPSIAPLGGPMAITTAIRQPSRPAPKCTHPCPQIGSTGSRKVALHCLTLVISARRDPTWRKPHGETPHEDGSSRSHSSSPRQADRSRKGLDQDPTHELRQSLSPLATRGSRAGFARHGVSPACRWHY
eukprot:14040459-Alexandrium_andersonii.AAC.1